jgi:hypothetical protein
MMIPDFDHGWRSEAVEAPFGSRPDSDVIRTVMLPSPASVRCTK